MPTDQEIVANHRLDLIEGYQAVTAEYEFLRDILRGTRPLDDVLEASPLDDYLGCAPPASYEAQAADTFEDEETSYGEQEDLPSGRYPTDGAEDDTADLECVRRQFSILGRNLVAEIEDDGWVLVVPADDRLGEPLLGGLYRDGRVVDVSCALPPVSTKILIETVEALFVKTLSNRRERRERVVNAR